MPSGSKITGAEQLSRVVCACEEARREDGQRELTLPQRPRPVAPPGTGFQPIAPREQAETPKQLFAPGSLGGPPSNSEKWETAPTPTERKHVEETVAH